jgi:antitoxin component of MazEF toxin-antitoxin module
MVIFMGVFESKVRMVGTSFGVLIPKEVVTEEQIMENQTVKMAILKKDLSLLEKEFGSVKTKPFKRGHGDRVI